MKRHIHKDNNSNCYIEWVVAITIMFATTFTVAETFVDTFYPILRVAAGIVRNLFLLLLIFYQIKHYGLNIKGKGFIFFTVYSIYILLYVTVFPVYKLDDLIKAPTSIANFFYRTGQVYIYLLSAQTILKHFNVTKFIIVSIFTAVIPCFIVIQYIGVETLQMFGSDDDSVVNVLAIGYCNSPLIVLSVLFCFKLFKFKIASFLLSLAVIICASFILLTGGERGPIIWTIVNLVICILLRTKHVVRIVFLLLVGILIFFANLNTVIDGLDSISPHAADKMESTFVEGDTNGRFDLDNSEGSTYIIGLKQFASSPLYGSYFRLITNHAVFRGHYPHNLFIEILMTMGLLGFLPFMYLMFIAFKKTIVVMRSNYTNAQQACLIMFLSSFLQLLTTATLVFNAAFWCFFYIVCNFDMCAENKKKTS